MSQTFAASRFSHRRPQRSMAIDLAAMPAVEVGANTERWAEAFIRTAMFGVTLYITMYHHEALLAAARAVWA
ncbi:MAG: hypothetical protein M3O62_18660 [Pseudomonadota bacterium]|nr:hypothetical protein [Pseudomonadota bacterium]